MDIEIRVVSKKNLFESVGVVKAHDILNLYEPYSELAIQKQKLLKTLTNEWVEIPEKLLNTVIRGRHTYYIRKPVIRKAK